MVPALAQGDGLEIVPMLRAANGVGVVRSCSCTRHEFFQLLAETETPLLCSCRLKSVTLQLSVALRCTSLARIESVHVMLYARIIRQHDWLMPSRAASWAWSRDPTRTSSRVSDPCPTRTELDIFGAISRARAGSGYNFYFRDPTRHETRRKSKRSSRVRVGSSYNLCSKHTL